MEHRMNVNENNPVTHVTGSFGIPVTHARVRARDADNETIRHMRHAHDFGGRQCAFVAKPKRCG